MKADLLLRKRIALSETAFVEMVVWHVPRPVRGSSHDFKYSLVLVADEICLIRYDTEAGKGDHKHLGDVEVAYKFVDLGQLDRDFWSDVEAWDKQR